jgi:hypothetical protein
MSEAVLTESDEVGDRRRNLQLKSISAGEQQTTDEKKRVSELADQWRDRLRRIAVTI